jgi:pimeloyl-ACP methyl ester carboxylesterase
MTVPFALSTVEVAGCRIALKRGGQGRPLLYLHGANGAAVIAPFMAQLAESFEVLVPEHPGFGASEEPGWLDNIHDLAYFYLDFIEQLDLRNLTLVGTSLGGWLALEIAVRNASRLCALTVVGPSGIYVPGLPRGDFFLWTPEERVRNLFVDQSIVDRLLAQRPSEQEAEIELKNQFTVARLAWEPRLFDPHLHKWLHRIKLPVQIVWGEADRILPAAYAAAFKSLIPQARIDVIPHCGHLPPIEKPAEFLRAFRDFHGPIPPAEK